MKRKLINLLCLFLMIGLVGCHPSDTQKERIEKGDTGFITDLDDKRVLIKSTYYKMTKETLIQDLQGRELSYEDLEIGMKVKPWYIGEIKESFPAKTKAKFLLVLTDAQSIAEQEAVKKAINHVTEAASQRFMVLYVLYEAKEKVYNIEMMNRSNTDTSFTVMVDERKNEVLY
ncbi:DUF3221 domain-containing protein [Peribacillus asahii]|uniref:DUF3221 domain-containing protein n=1 Tax=Peribacillus asahii TaxID=228899 RepID=UPI00207A8BCD|nr:DUF3221 domain-containing protein [Peribacillus asahii]USK58703.1 YobA family protein [Peribacillus asahii]